MLPLVVHADTFHSNQPAVLFILMLTIITLANNKFVGLTDVAQMYPEGNMKVDRAVNPHLSLSMTSVCCSVKLSSALFSVCNLLQILMR